MNGHKTGHSRRATNGTYRVRPEAFVFFDRRTGTKRFEVKASSDGSLPIEEASSVLATQCVVRGQAPGDFRVLVSISERVMDGLVPRAKKLMKACMATALPMYVSQRQQEVLRYVLQNLSNKEIAAKLNVSERTVKFHVSALLKKFHVTGRVGLMQKAADMFSLQSSGFNVRSQSVAREAPGTDSQGEDSQPKLLRIASSERRAR